MNPMYKRGVRLEREVMQIFKEHGYIVMRTAGSHSPFDVVLVKEEFRPGGIKRICFVAFVQCKTKKK